MYPYERIMVGLDLTEMDKTLLEYTSFFSKITKPQKIYFVHAVKDLDIDEELINEIPELKHEPFDELKKEEMHAEVNKYFEGIEGLEISFEVLEGNPLRELLQWSKIKMIDLVIVGRKIDMKGSGVIPQKLARKVGCSVLFVPEGAKAEMNSIIVPTDFSDYSAMATEEAMNIAKDSSKLICQHIYSVPTGYYKTGKTYGEFAEIMKGHAIRAFEKFKSKMAIDEPIEAVYSLDDGHNLTNLIMEEAHKNKAGIIVIGGRGRSSAAAIMLGSVAEKTIKKDIDIPLLVVKKKNENMGFLEALLKI